jgi:hypothetical protein
MRICSIEGCGRKHFTHGYCTTHYQCFKRTGSPIPTREQRTRGGESAIRVDGEVAFVDLGKGREAMIDTADIGLVTGRYWQPQAGSLTMYAKSGNREKVYMHRLITGAPEGSEVDHINWDGLDNRRENLRVTDRTGNMQNARWRNQFGAIHPLHPDA